MLSKKQRNIPILDRRVLRELFRLVKPYQHIFRLLIVLTLAVGVIGPSRPFLVQHTLDHYITKEDYAGLVGMAVGLLILLATQVLVQYYLIYLSEWLGQHIAKDLRVQIYTHTIRMRISFYHKTPIGRLVTRNISDTEMIAHVFNEGLATLLADLLQLLAVAAFMVYIDWQLALLSLAILPLLSWSIYLLKERLKFAYKQVRNAMAQLNTFVQVRLTGMSMIQIFNREQQELAQFEALNAVHRNAHNKSVFYYALYFPVLEMLRAIGISLLIWYGAHSVIKGYISLGKLTAFLMYLTMFFRPLYYLVERFNTLQMGLVSADRIIRLLENTEQAQNQGTYLPKCVQGAITFDKVWFAYEGDNYVLKDVSFHIQAQKSLAIVGATGAGKSTIANLLERFYDAQQGTIALDGANILDYDVRVLRQNIGLVLQDVFLFSTSIHDNITLGNKAIPSERVVEAAQLVGIHDFIQSLPGGYNYNVQEGGMTLSMGQRQLLAFARVFVYDPCILILDEATASMDTATEALIQQATARLLQSRTAIIIAHRLATIRHADEIIVLDQGRVREQGTHEDLLVQNGAYASLYKTQYQ
ncbi:MAG: ABC transporter ATP-binding protein [Bacteroidota bacterium]